METTTQQVSLWRAAAIIAADIKLAHSVFALPFALLGACIAAGDLTRSDARSKFIIALVLVVVCMVAARTWAMLFNRLVDRKFDAENRRTSRRVFASGTLSIQMGWIAAIASAIAFILATSLFWVISDNPWPLYLSVPVLIWIAFYSLTKRFTALCHLFLGGALAASPLAAATAMNPSAISNSTSLLWISGFVLFWVAGFDIIYALADQGFDKIKGLRSIPAAVGTSGALRISRCLHAIAAACLYCAWAGDQRFGLLMLAGVILVWGLLIIEHIVVAKRGEAGLDMAFFTINGIVSCILGAVGIADLYL